jgi:ABC-type phosphate/phosphonate transport system substrate-binding protein
VGEIKMKRSIFWVIAMLFIQIAAGYGNEQITIGFMRSQLHCGDSRDIAVAIEMWSQQLVETMNEKLGKNYEAKTIVVKTLGELEGILEDGTLDLISLSSFDFFKIKAGIIDPALVAQSGTLVGEEFLLITHKESQINDVFDLESKNIILPGGFRGDIVEMWLTNMIKKKDCARFFSQMKEEEKSSHAVLPVFFQQADACVISRDAFETMAKLNPQLRENLKIVDASDNYLTTLSCVAKKTDESIKNTIIETAVEMHYHPTGKQILSLFKQSQVVRFQDQYFQNIRKLISINNMVMLD